MGGVILVLSIYTFMLRTGTILSIPLRPIHTYHAVPMPFPCSDPALALRGCFQNGIFVAWQGNGMVCVNQTRPHCVNQMGKTQSKPIAERHGRGTEW
jgi:hypothetical protein